MGGGYSADKYLPKLGDHLFVIIDGSVKHYLDAQICVQLPLIRGHHTYMILHSPTQGTYLVKEKQGNGWLSARDSRTLLTWAHNHFTTENLANEELEQFVNTLLAQQEFQEEPEEWFFSSNALNQKIWTLQDEKTPYQICEIDPLRQEPVTALLHQCLKAMKNSRPLNMKKVFAIDNKQLYAAFSIQKDMMMRRWQASEELFRSKKWRNLPDRDTRVAHYQRFQKYACSFPWNDPDSPVPMVVPMVHALGTTQDAAWKIVRSGFATVSTLDQGFFGKGIYFTSDIEYASLYSQLAARPSPKLCLILSMVVPGNIYPVTEDHRSKDSLCGKPVTNGYQSHFTHVSSSKDKDYGCVCNPARPDSYDELVVFQDFQALPLYVIYC